MVSKIVAALVASQLRGRPHLARLYLGAGCHVGGEDVVGVPVEVLAGYFLSLLAVRVARDERQEIVPGVKSV